MYKIIYRDTTTGTVRCHHNLYSPQAAVCKVQRLRDKHPHYQYSIRHVDEDFREVVSQAEDLIEASNA